MAILKQARNLIDEALALMPREPPISKTAVKSEAVTSQIVGQVKFTKALHPELSLQEIADRYNINSGRVSEILHGKWDHLLIK